MPRKGLGFRKTLRDQRIDVNRALDHYAILSGKPTPEGLKNVIAPVRERAKPVQREAPVVAAISELLAVHPKVAFACRQNSGSASYEAKSGKYAPVAFYRILTGAKELTVVDFWGFLKDGRIIAVEAKAPGWTKPRDDHERKQYNFLALVRNCGGVALFATDAADVAAALC